jgi:transcription termination factor Rho
MPVRKTTRTKKAKAEETVEDASIAESKEEAVPSSPSPEEAPSPSPGSSSDRQLFFSTDGDEPEQERPRPKEDLNPAESKSSVNADEDSPKKQETDSPRSSKDENANSSPRHHPNQGGANAQGQKKLTWQEKKKLRRKQKFKQPRRLPYEETEAKPLDVGQLLDCEDFKTDEGIESLLQPLLESGKDRINLDDYLSLNLLDLTDQVRKLDLDEAFPSAPLREELIDLVLDSAHKSNTPVALSGIIQVMEDGHGFILQQKEDYRLKSQSAFIPERLVRKFGLKTGHLIQGVIRAKMEESTCPVMLQVDAVMGKSPEEATRVTPFTELTPYYPLRRMYLETHQEVKWDNVAMRVVDLVSPVGFGQRGLIVAPPRTGKTVLQQAVARALRENNPDAHLIVLLVDERPEEVTDFRRQVPDAEVIASTFDESAESHVHAAEIVIEKARRMVEHEQHVVILLDSITRLARAYNTTMPNSGKILSGGVEATALQRPKRFFGSARNIEGGGSLTILGTALVETGSKMDEVIFEEFKGTGNMELHLDRELSNKRIFPALDFEKSGTRKEELLYHPDELSKIYALRRSMKGVPPAEAMEMFIQRVKKTKNNPEFLMGLGR